MLEILLVEDDQIDILNIKRALTKLNIQNILHVARDGLEALEMLRSTADKAPLIFPQLILLDINMPRMNGLEFLRALRQEEPLRNINVVALTTSDEEKDIWEAYNLHVAGYILKPVVPQQFYEAISSIGSYWTMCRSFPQRGEAHG